MAPVDVGRYRELWYGFTENFKFAPSVKLAKWPGLRVPAPGLCFDISLHATTREEFTQRSGEVNAILWKLVEDEMASGVDGELFALEWQHGGYRLEFAESTESGHVGPIGLFPDGEYPLLMAASGAFYLFGQPWEKMISLFGNAIPAPITDYLESTFPLSRA